MTSAENYSIETQPPAPEGVGRIDVSYGQNNSQLLNRLIDFRTDFVKKMGWLPADLVTDRDKYDDLEETLHLAIMDHDTNEILAALRLVPESSVQHSQSWSMFTEGKYRNEDMMRQAYSYTDENGDNLMQKLNESASRGNLWDLTRLVAPLGKDVDMMKVAAGMMELFGTGRVITQRQTSPDQLDDIKWVFTATPDVKNALIGFGIQVDVLAGGKINGDKVESYFCAVDVEKSYDHIYGHAETDCAFAHEFAENGRKKAFAL